MHDFTLCIYLPWNGLTQYIEVYAQHVDQDHLAKVQSRIVYAYTSTQCSSAYQVLKGFAGDTVQIYGEPFHEYRDEAVMVMSFRHTLSSTIWSQLRSPTLSLMKTSTRPSLPCSSGTDG